MATRGLACIATEKLMQLVLLCAALLCIVESVAYAIDPWQNYSLPIDERVEDLLKRLTLEEKIQQTWSVAPAIAHLQIPAYNWRSNCVHGWAKSGGKWSANETWTVFPTPLMLAASWDRSLMRIVGSVTADEGRALHNLAVKAQGGASPEARGINCFAPNVNFCRHPLWGRNQETLGEDPVLLSELAVYYTKGLQEGLENEESTGKEREPTPKYLKVAANSKHYAVHEGPETDPVDRSKFIAIVNKHDIYDYYIEGHKAVIQKADIATVMCAYSSTNYSKNAPDCASDFLLKDILRTQLQFNGAVISDNGAVRMVYETHHWSATSTEATASCLNAGCDMDLGPDAYYPVFLKDALTKKLTSETIINQAVGRLLRIRFSLGEFDPEERVPYRKLGKEVLDTSEHRALNLRAAREGIVLVMNENNAFLPLHLLTSKSAGSAGLSHVKQLSSEPSVSVIKSTAKHSPQTISTIAVIGWHATDTTVLLANYEGIPSHVTTVLEGVQNYVNRIHPATKVVHALGCSSAKCESSLLFSEALKTASTADVIIVTVGINQDISREGHDWDSGYLCDLKSVGPAGGLPGCQYPLLKQLNTLNKPLVLVMVTGNPISIQLQTPSTNMVMAILYAFYPGAEGGQAVAEAIFGEFSPSGRLPFTVYANVSSLPDMGDQDMTRAPGKTYRYYQGSVLFPFGFGLSYTNFLYSSLSLSASALVPCQSLTASLSLINSGSFKSDEIVQVYLRYESRSWSSPPASISAFPYHSLRNFTRVLGISPQEQRSISFVIHPEDMTVVDDDGIRWIMPGQWRLFAGHQQPSRPTLSEHGADENGDVLDSVFSVSGKPTPIASCLTAV
eukprot:TRINITY_DN233_c0_g3_i1.p1 TRINITY_DN233_c0_g3~~TRINITY_DN233_c0_g3_i1.p1  ORF type:complete len:846 (+),score=181.20 TRINITY_DN233_c0_g3_i1:96-2633(+)